MMPVRGGKTQKRVNEGGHGFSLDGRNSNLDSSFRQQYGLFAAAGLDPPPSQEELVEIEALLEREQELLGQHPLAPSSINLLHSPEHRLRPQIESSQHRSHTPRSISRTHGSNSVPLNQLTSIILNMTFSDAEEDHQGSRDGRERTNSGGNDGGNSDRERSTSRSRTESGVSNASTVSLAFPATVPPPPPPPVNGEADGPSTSSGRASNSGAAAGNSSAASSVSKDDLTNRLLDMKSCVLMARGLMRRIASGRGVDSKKIMEKLQQIQGYIQQTAAAMAALEQQGDLGNIGQYNTLVKVMRDLKDSETKLKGHLDAALKNEGAAAQVVNGVQGESSGTSPPANGVAESTPANSDSSGNQVVGIVRASNVPGLSLQERLIASQVESSAIVTRMRDSIARREDLMSRYKATRERLENLKKQRQDMREEQRRLMEASNASEENEDPVPGAETWSSEDIASSILEFQALFEKVDRIQDVYQSKAESLDPEDEEAQAHVASKLEQVAQKRRQLINALTKLRQIQRSRASGEQTDAGESPPDSQPSSSTVGATSSAPPHAESDGNQTVSSALPAPNDNASGSGMQSQQGADESGSLDMSVTLARVSRINDEVSSKQNELATLQKQFSDMKKLLDAATTARKEEEQRMIASQKRLEEAQELLAESRRVTRASDELRQIGSEEGAVGGEIISLSGRRIQLSEAERQDPVIKSKYQDLAKAKERLAKMEEVMSMITSAQKNRQDLRDVLPPEYMALLEEAESEYPGSSRRRQQRTEVPVIEEESEDDIRASRRYQRSGRRGSASRGETSGSLGRSERDRYSREQENREVRDRHTREQENREISAMQKRLNKTTSRISAVNEGSRHGHEKGAIKKQPEALWQERNSNVDPRMTEVMALQEELKQKKNALEALMRRMGKSSSLNMDNISDNISDNVSDNASDRMDGGTAATWGSAALDDYSDNRYHQSSDDELVEGDDAEALPRSHRRSQPPFAAPPKDRNHYSGTSRHRRRQDSGHFSVNNLATAPSGRPKHNRFRGSSLPKASWESVPSLDDRNFKSPSNTTLQAQQSIGAALSQLSQVQGTINNLHETLRHEQNHLMSQGNIHTQVVPHMLRELPTPSLPSSSVSHIPGMGVQPLTPMSAYSGLGSLALGTSEPSGQQMVALLQQCISQLQLHSLEIQALSKHLQLLDRRDMGGSAPISDSGGGGRLGRGGARRSEEEEEEEDDDEDDEDVTTGTHPSYPLHRNHLGAPLSQEERESAPQMPASHSFPLYLGQAGDEPHSTGVTNPIYGRLGDIRDHSRAWGSHDATPGVEQSSDHLGSMIGAAGVMESSPSHPLMHLDRMSEERPHSQPQAPEDHHWASLASSHPLHHQTTDLLNNQVPPGTRANNYWDNFRSYSRQNLLSTTTKSNTSEHRPSSCTSAAGASGIHTRHQSGDGSQVEDKRFNVAVTHNNNSSSGGGGARARVSNPRINNPKGARVRNPVSSNRQQVHGQNKHKSNNRMKQGDWYSQGSTTNIPEGNTPQGTASSGISQDRSLVNYNSTRANSSDSDVGIGGVTLEVLREAESLMRRHANQPEFLLQLFRHASQITVHTDQHVAVALLQDLAARPHRTNHGVNANYQGNSNESNNLSLPAPLRESSWRRASGRSDHHNIVPQENGSAAGISGSEVSDSGLTSEDEDSRALYRNVKNLSLSPGAQAGIVGTLPWASATNIGAQPRPQYPPSPQQCHPHFPHHNYQYFPQQNLSNNQGSSRSVANSESSIYDRLVYNESHLCNEHPQEADERWLNRENAEQRARKSQNEVDTAGSSPEHAPHITHPLSNDTEFLSFESLVSSAVRASVELLQGHAGSAVTPANTVTPLLLSAIHNTVVGLVQTQSQSLNLPQSFLYSVDTELKSALQAFVGKRLMEVSNEVPSVISQALFQQYCSVLVQRLRDNHTALPQTPTKLPQKQTQMSDTSGDAAASGASVIHTRHTQENSTATQTESSVFSIMPNQHSGLSSSADLAQRPSHHTHPVTIISGASGISLNSSHSSVTTTHPSMSSSTHSSAPHPSPHISNSLFQSSSSSGQWPAPFTVPAPSPSGPSVSESGLDNAVINLPTSQPEGWAASSLIGHHVTGSPLSLSRPESRSASNSNQTSSGAMQEWAEPEHEEAVMDEPMLPVYDLAEADQSQDAGDAAEGDWEDSQAEGIQVDGSGAIIDESPEHPIRLQAEMEGMAECEADAAEVSGRGAMGHLLYGDHLVQGAARELGLDEVPTKLQSPDGGSPSDTPEHHCSTPQGHHSSTPEGQHHSTGSSHAVQPLHSPGSEG